ncbi:MAG: helix-turn-helix transcriptional regulator, partial [Halieaceae bacterium]
MDALTTFSRVVSEATSLLGESSFAAALGNGMRELIEADDVSLIRYPDTGPPVIEYTLPPKRRGKTTLDRYVKGPFLLDPFYRAAQVDERFGVFRLRDLAPSGFKESEYFRTWYHECGFQDE